MTRPLPASTAPSTEPGYAPTLVSRGEAYKLMRRYEEALADFNRAIELNPGYARAIADRGDTYQRVRRYGEALADLDRAIGLDPSKDWAIASRGETYLAMRRYGEALGHWPRRSASSSGGTPTMISAGSGFSMRRSCRLSSGTACAT
jgi:tetratricopeptide (TPR) repeat protein